MSNNSRGLKRLNRVYGRVVQRVRWFNHLAARGLGRPGPKNSPSRRRKSPFSRRYFYRKLFRTSLIEPLEARVLLARDSLHDPYEDSGQFRPHETATDDAAADDRFGVGSLAGEAGGIDHRASVTYLVTAGAEVPSTGEEAAGAVLVFVDPAVDDYRQLLAGLDGLEWNRGNNAEPQIRILDGGRDGIEQITEALAAADNVAAVHIFSHGTSGSLQLGSGRVDGDSLHGYAAQLRSWRAHLGGQADILLYGCNVAEGQWGVRFVERLAALTGADIAASHDLTGSTDLGGDWDLEYATGTVTVGAAIGGDSLYDGLLVAIDEVTKIARAEAVDFGAADIQLVDDIKGLDLSVLDQHLKITVEKYTTDNNYGQIKVQKVDDQGGDSGAPATYRMKVTGGKLPKLIAGHDGKKVTILLKLNLEELDLSAVADLQVALAKDLSKAPYPGLPGDGSVLVQFDQGIKLDELTVGKAATNVELIVGNGIEPIGKLKKAMGHMGKLKLNYPEKTTAKYAALVDLSSVNPVITGFTRLQGYRKNDVIEIGTAAG
ncbi:MAG: DUF4347 domain-containing protein, partial [Pirellulales bacterium]